MTYTIYKGRPLDYATRAPRERRVYDLLDSLGIQYDRIDHLPADTMEVCATIDETFGRMTLDDFQNADADAKTHPIICKNLLLCNRPRTHFFLLMMPGSKPFHTKDITSQIECGRLSFATADDMLQMLDIIPGSVSAMGLMNDHERRVQLLIDRDVTRSDYFGCHPCVNTSSLRLRLSDLTDKILPHINHLPHYVTLP